VIPPWFEPSDFPFSASSEDYVAYVGRIVPAKGIRTVCDAAQRAGVRLRIMGHGVPSLITYGEWMGEGTMAERNALLSKARAVLMPTQYLEPFGNVAAEAQLCGTPMITTDYGAFPESVEQGVSGFRCSSLGEFVEAIDRVGELDRRAIHARAVRLYSTETALRNYAAYFKRFDTLGGEGWRSLEPGLNHGASEPLAASAAA
jgi:glycosyltransferase involved in cell wall biosynthesis